jgi:hypothetical protein
MKTIIAAVLITASRAFAFDSFDQSQREVRDLEDVPAANARSIDDRLDVEIRAALVACVADEGPIAREKLSSKPRNPLATQTSARNSAVASTRRSTPPTTLQDPENI